MNKALVFLSLFPIGAFAGQFQDTLYNKAEDLCLAEGYAPEKSEKSWLMCMDMRIKIAHTLALDELGLTAPPHGTPEQLTRKNCEDRGFWEMLKVNNAEACFDALLPIQIEADRRAWSSTSWLD